MRQLMVDALLGRTPMPGDAAMLKERFNDAHYDTGNYQRTIPENLQFRLQGDLVSTGQKQLAQRERELAFSYTNERPRLMPHNPQAPTAYPMLIPRPDDTEWRTR